MNELTHDKTNKMICAPSEDTDQPGHPPSLISLRCPHEGTLGTQLLIELIRVFSGCTVVLLVLSRRGSNVKFIHSDFPTYHAKIMVTFQLILHPRPIKLTMTARLHLVICQVIAPPRWTRGCHIQSHFQEIRYHRVSILAYNAS